MVLRFEQKVDGIPLEVAVQQRDGSEKLVSLFVATDEKSLVELLDKSNEIKVKTEEISKKYPVLGTGIEDENTEQLKEAIQGATELVKANYDDLFGEGTYQKLSEAGLGLLKLIPLLDKLADGVSEEIENEQSENTKQSNDRKAQRLIRNKKKRK